MPTPGDLLSLLPHDTAIIKLPIDLESLPGVAVIYLVEKDDEAPAPITPPPVILPALPHRALGIDASRYQPRIDFKVAKDQGGVEFALLKMSEGYNYVDPNFFTNFRKAEEAGVQVGAYHFFRPDLRNPKGEAELIRRTLGDKWGLMGLWIDVENCVANGKVVPPATYAQTIESDLRTLLDQLETFKPADSDIGIYTGAGYWDSVLSKAVDILNSRWCWIANYPYNYTDSYRPRLPRGMQPEHLKIWQFDNGEMSWSVKVPGVTDLLGRPVKVDRNFFWRHAP